MLISTFSLISIAVELRRLRSGLAKPMDGLRPVRPAHPLSASAGVPLGASAGDHPFRREVGVMGSPAGYAIFVYRQGRWELESDLSTPGYAPSAPSISGAYEGQVIKKESRLASAS
jgi:hypothetical protein